MRAKRRAFFDRERVSLVIDVGANAGQYARMIRHDGFRGQIYSFEPLTAAFEQLAARAAADRKWSVHQYALGADDRQASMNVSANLVSSSLLAIKNTSVQAAPASAYEGVETVRVRRLDDIRKDLLSPGDRPFLKLDVQGYEDQVLRGGQDTLQQIVGLECELSLVPLYDGQLLAGEMLSLLASAGFHPVWLERGFTDRVSGHMLQLDVLFGRLGRSVSPSQGLQPE